MKEYTLTIGSRDELFGAMKDTEISYPDHPESETEFWEVIGKTIVEQGFTEPDDIIISDAEGNFAEIEVKFYESESPRPSYKLAKNDFKFLKKSHYDRKCLRNVDVEKNKKSFYDIVPHNMGPITIDVGAEYGILGTNAVEEGNVTRPFPTELYWLKYYQKLSEGYTDETEYIGEGKNPLDFLYGRISTSFSDEDDTAVNLYRELREDAKDVLSQSFNIDWLSENSPYTTRQIESCWKVFATLLETVNEKTVAKAVKKANDCVLKLLKVASPQLKRGVRVESFLVKEDTDFDKVKNNIISVAQDWENRIQAMEAIATKKTESGEKKLTPFGNVDVRKATAEEFKHMQDLIAARCPHKVHMLKEVYMLTPYTRKKKYEEALKNSEHKEEREFFHGSLTSNMISLISSGGPTIRVSAANGRMFGDGSYWANDFDKSLGYTSYRDSRWANGNSDYAFMLVGKVHYGKPLIVNSWNDFRDYKKAVEDGNYDCLHAKAGRSLRKDEIITYDEDHSYVEAILKFA